MFSPIVHTNKMRETLTEMTVYDAFFRKAISKAFIFTCPY